MLVYRGLILCFIVSFFNTAFAEGDYAVLMQESPAGAGVITPGIGVHTFEINETVTLTTVPNTGWKFVYWLGDVQDSTVGRTKLNVNGPKIIIAVFEQDKYAAMDSSAGPQISVGPPALYPNRISIRGGEYTGGGSRRYNPPNNTLPYIPPDEPENMAPPVPENQPSPVPEEIPEPATMLLLGMGASLLFINRKNNTE
ncbi:MAG: PEP-CTERM sorting domain-containing protein [Phycisphaerae bacterium]